MALDPTVIALIGTVFGGVGLKVAERWLERPREISADATKIRDELRAEITSQKEEIKNLEEQVNKWREDYYNMKEQKIKVDTELTIALNQLHSLAGPMSIDTPKTE